MERRVGSSGTDQDREGPLPTLPYTEPSVFLVLQKRPQLRGWHPEILPQPQPHPFCFSRRG